MHALIFLSKTFLKEGLKSSISLSSAGLFQSDEREQFLQCVHLSLCLSSSCQNEGTENLSSNKREREEETQGK